MLSIRRAWMILKRETKFTRRMEVRAIAGWAAVREADVMCDIGCGDGYYTWRLGRAARLVVGVDVDMDALQRAKRGKYPHCEFVVASAEALPFRANVFTKIVSVCALEHFSNDGRALGEISRVLRPGCCVCLSVDSLTCSWIPVRWREAHRRNAKVLNYYDHTSLADKLAAAGLAPDRWRYLVTSRLSSFLVRLGSLWGGRMFSVTCPIFYPLVLLSDRITNTRRGGHKLAIRAFAVEPPRGSNRLAGAEGQAGRKG